VLQLQPFEGSHDADVAHGENVYDTQRCRYPLVLLTGITRFTANIVPALCPLHAASVRLHNAAQAALQQQGETRRPGESSHVVVCSPRERPEVLIQIPEISQVPKLFLRKCTFLSLSRNLWL